jgi:hypothetical protein
MRIMRFTNLALLGVVAFGMACDEPAKPGTTSNGSGNDDDDAEESGDSGSATSTTASAGDTTTATTATTTDGGALPPAKLCVDLIDDLESGMTLIPAGDAGNAPRQGAWFTYNDIASGGTTGMQTPEPMVTAFLPDASMGGAPTSDLSVTQTLYAARTYGGGFGLWGAGMGFNINDEGCVLDEVTMQCPTDYVSMPMVYDVTQFTGISFYSKYYGAGPGIPAHFKVVTQGVVPDTSGGTCVVTDGGQCDAAYETTISILPNWSAHEVPFDLLAQPTYAGNNAIDFDPATVFALQWQIDVNTDFDFAIDEICFY